MLHMSESNGQVFRLKGRAETRKASLVSIHKEWLKRSVVVACWTRINTLSSNTFRNFFSVWKR